MKRITVDARFIRAAQACQADKDVRYYLNGICFHPGGKISGTNGHVLFHGTYTLDQENMVDEEVIIQINGKIPVAAMEVTFIPDPGEFNSGYCKTDNGKAFLFKGVDGKYVDVTKVLPGDEQGQEFSDGFGANPRYLSLIEKVFYKADGVIIKHTRPVEPVVITLGKGRTVGGKIRREEVDLFREQALMLVMPMRSWDREDDVYRTGREVEAAGDVDGGGIEGTPPGAAADGTGSEGGSAE